MCKSTGLLLRLAIDAARFGGQANAVAVSGVTGSAFGILWTSLVLLGHTRQLRRFLVFASSVSSWCPIRVAVVVEVIIK